MQDRNIDIHTKLSEIRDENVINSQREHNSNPIKYSTAQHSP